VNSAIWKNSPKVDVGSYATNSAPRARTRWATVRGGVYYEIVDGELTSTDADGVRRLLGNGIVSVFPTTDGVFSVMPGEAASPSSGASR